jgi:hypothetical protein
MAIAALRDEGEGKYSEGRHWRRERRAGGAGEELRHFERLSISGPATLVRALTGKSARTATTAGHKALDREGSRCAWNGTRDAAVVRCKGGIFCMSIAISAEFRWRKGYHGCRVGGGNTRVLTRIPAGVDEETM